MEKKSASKVPSEMAQEQLNSLLALTMSLEELLYSKGTENRFHCKD
jgi:hypothetical protein